MCRSSTFLFNSALHVFVLIDFNSAHYLQHVKQAILDEKYATIIKVALEKHLQANTTKPANMVHVARKTIWEERKELADVKVGDWVEVMYDYLPGTCSDGGIGVITRLIATDTGPGTVSSLFATVQYVLDNRQEHGVAMDRLTIIPMPFKTSEVKLQAPKNFEKLVEKHTPLGWLKWGSQHGSMKGKDG
jgi:hypothetical protein